MKSPFRALLWEQSRVAGVLSLWLILLSVPLFLILLVQNKIMPYRENLFLVGAALLFLGYGMCIIYRLDAEGHLTGAFEQRLTRLPVKTLMLVLSTLCIRFAFLFLTGCAFSFLAFLFGGAEIPLPIFIGILEVYLLYQTVDWTRKYIRGAGWIPLLLLLPVCFRTHWARGK